MEIASRVADRKDDFFFFSPSISRRLVVIAMGNADAATKVLGGRKIRWCVGNEDDEILIFFCFSPFNFLFDCLSPFHLCQMGKGLT